MPISLEHAALNLFLALVCGALIGSERQVRQRMAGLRTNALVALGAAGFVVFSALFPHEVSPTRVAAQVVSGIGFLGAGIIFRHGFTIHGLNTAATLWCSAAVGLMAGAGAPVFAVMLTCMIVFVNLGLRPIVKWIKKKTNAGVPMRLEYRITLTCDATHEANVRALVLNCLSLPDFQINGIQKHAGEMPEVISLEISVTAEDLDDMAMNKAMSPIMIDPKVVSLGWDSSTEA